MGKRALLEADKLQRRNVLLEAASRLLDEVGYHQVSVSAVAAAAGLAKGTVYLYFKTKEELFVALLQEQMFGWMAAIGQAAETRDAQKLITTLVDYVATRPQFLTLAASSPTLLEHNLSPEFLKAYKVALAETLWKTGVCLEQGFNLSEGLGARILLHAYSLTMGTWQVANPPQAVQDLIREEGLLVFQRNFKEDLTDGLAHLWRGYVS